MAKELYLYTALYSYVAESVNKELDKVPDSEKLTFRLNGPGGTTNAGFAILNKLSERKTETDAIVDGQAKSMLAYMLPFFNYVKAHQASEISFHKAAYEDWYRPSEQELKTLKIRNEQFEKIVRKKVNGRPGAEAFLTKLFEPDVRNTIDLTSKEALNLNLINEVVELEPSAFDGKEMIALIDKKEIKSKITPENQESNNNNLNNPIMTIDELKSKHPGLYAQIFGEGEKAGIKAGEDSEFERSGSWLAFKDIDPEAVSKGIESRKPCTPKDQAEFVAKSIKGARITAIEDENSPETNPPADGKTKEQIKAEADKKAMDEFMNDGKDGE